MVEYNRFAFYCDICNGCVSVWSQYQQLASKVWNSQNEIESLWDRKSGAINPLVADHWRKYDIIEFLKETYDSIAKDLQDKIIVTCGTEDNFMLEVPVQMLKKVVEDNHWEMKVNLVPGDHFTLDYHALYKKWRDFLNDRISQFQSK